MKKEKAALYIRVSTHHQIDKDSLPYQKKELVNYAKFILGIDDFEIFEDAGYSGKDTDRPAYQDMMKRVRDGEFTHILVWKLDRISRNLMDFTKMYEELKDYDVTFISKNEQFDTSTAMGEAMLKIILVFAELERKLTAERVYGIMLSRAEKGLWNGAPVPLGYFWPEDADFPEIDPNEAGTVQFIYDAYQKYKSTGEVKHLLEVKDMRTKKGKNWTTKTVSDIIRNPFYKGTYRYNYRKAGRGTIKNEEEWIVVPNNHDPIISEEQWDICNFIMDSNYKARAGDRTLKNHTHVFAQLISCGKCNKNYIATIDRPRADGYRPSVYRCHNYVHSKKAYRVCEGNIGEVKLGPFVMNYISNLVRVSNMVNAYGRRITEKDIEKELLKGSLFKNIVGIHPEDLTYTHNILLRNTGDILFDKNLQENEEEDEELEKLRIEKSKLERAMKRLEDLYLFSEDSMSEKNYLIRKQEIDKKISSLNNKIRKKSKELAKVIPGHDLNFIKKATQYLLANNLINSKKINYNSMVKSVDKTLLKDFMNCVIKKIVVEENRTISSIEFINGISHRFIYRD